jgi:predicted transcriptional regulator
MARSIARAVALDYETADAAIDYAIQKGWLNGEGEPPHSVCLTDDGRRLSAISRRRAP